jgi:hypothetical protein
MDKSKKAKYRKGTTWLRIRKFNIDGLGKQTIINLGGYQILIGSLENTRYIKFGDGKCGVTMTDKPSFSVRNKLKKSLKIGRYYISKL